MKKTVLFLAAAIGMNFAYGQCSTTIFPQPGHVPITSNQSINATGTVYWICSGLTVTILSSQGDAYLCESNVTLNIVGSAGDQVFAKSGCVINNSSSAAIGVVCNPANVTLNNTGTGSITVDAVCNPVVFDYSMIGGPGNCAGSSGTEDHTLSGVSAFPNPFVSTLVIAWIRSEGEAILYDVLGKEVQRWRIYSGENNIETRVSTTGVYFLKVRTDEGTATLKLVKY